MSKRMLIDARHTEETRVTVISGNRVEEFDYESSNRRELKGNIYLAKITRVEPSLQAAFVDYGGNRHGFLAFSEIHPDYYQIPVEDREAILAQEAAIHAADEDDGDEVMPAPEGEAIQDAAAEVDADAGDIELDREDPLVDAVSSSDEDELEQENLRLRRLRQLKHRYKIQEVIKPRQILLIQVVKEERGNKGAALTTYLSLAGRYTVLMPNTTHGGGVSRKIANTSDRKRLKSIISELNVPAGTGCIVRTAGMKRTKTEIKRDVDYLFKIWSNIRELTMRSVAPSLVYEEGNLIKRAIRDLYDRNIDEVLVDGAKGYRSAKEFMTLLMPSHAKRVQSYTDKVPLFQRFQIESQLESIYSEIVTLKSGGYIVINPTEALISIDVNSGRATKHRNIEETAIKTNIESAYEIARQLRLRDMAGLVVIDFIDMEDRGNNRKVERTMKEALKADRARIQVGRISPLGLMEISRQRLHPNLVESSTHVCDHCNGTGRVRTSDSAALQVLRTIEAEAIRGRYGHLKVGVHPDVAIYALNNKRADISELEVRYGITVEIFPKSGLVAPEIDLVGSGTATKPGTKITPPAAAHVPVTGSPSDHDDDDADEPEDLPTAPARAQTSSETSGEASSEDEGEKKGRSRGGRRRGRRGGRRARASREARAQKETGDEVTVEASGTEGPATDGGGATAPADDKTATKEADGAPSAPARANIEETPSDEGEKKPRRARRRPAKKTPADSDASADASANAVASPNDAADAPDGSADKAEKPKRGRRKPAQKDGEAGANQADAAATVDVSVDKAGDEKPAPKRRPRRAAAKKDTPAQTGDKAVKAAPDTAAADKSAGDAPSKAEATKAVAKKPTAKKSTAKKADDQKVSDKKAPAKKAPTKKAPGKKPVPPVAKSPAVEAAKEAAPQNDQPKKKGWWQRG